MPRLAIAFDADWQFGKRQILTLEIRRLLIRSGGASNIGNIEPIGATVEPERYLVLACTAAPFGNRCGAEWESPVFTPCPKCGQRRFVHKVEARKEVAETITPEELAAGNPEEQTETSPPAA